MRYWIRHDRPKIAPGICYGWTDLDPAVKPEATAALIQAKIPAGLPIYASPLRRCRLLAEKLRCNDLIIEPDLREIHFGQWESQAWDDIPRTEIDAWAADPFGYEFPQGESVPEFLARVNAAIKALPESCIIVTHGGVIRTAHHVCTGISLADAFALRIAFGSVAVL